MECCIGREERKGGTVKGGKKGEEEDSSFGLPRDIPQGLSCQTEDDEEGGGKETYRGEGKELSALSIEGSVSLR